MCVCVWAGRGDLHGSTLCDLIMWPAVQEKSKRRLWLTEKACTMCPIGEMAKSGSIIAGVLSPTVCKHAEPKTRNCPKP